MQRIAIVILILAVAAGVYLLIESWGSVQEETRDDLDTPSTPPAGNGDPDSGLAPPVRPGPPPKAEVMQLKAPAGLLMLARHRDSWTAMAELTFDSIEDLEYRTWYLSDPRQPDAVGGVPGKGRGLSELTAKPTAAWVEAENIKVLVLDQADPNAFSMDFWNAVGERVRDGRMGLYVRPGFPISEGGQAQSVHPVLTHPVLKDLMPVARATPLEGDPLPGVFKEKQALVVTPEGTRHPAARIVTNVEASKALWAQAGVGEGSWGSKYCYPVQEVSEGAIVLANLEAATPIPALIVSAAPARVIWVGNVDFGGRKTHFTMSKDRLRKILLTHWWVWLAGQLPQ